MRNLRTDDLFLALWGVKPSVVTDAASAVAGSLIAFAKLPAPMTAPPINDFQMKNAPTHTTVILSKAKDTRFLS